MGGAWPHILFSWWGVGLVTPSTREGQMGGRSVVLEGLSLPAAFCMPGHQVHKMGLTLLKSTVVVQQD